MKIIYIGSVQFSATALKKLLSIGAKIVGVITKKESKINSDFFDLSSIAILNKIPFHYTNDINSEKTLKWIEEKKPDVLFCFGWSNLIEKDVLNMTSMGVVGFHPSLLPNNKGRHPLIWAKVLGLSYSGTTFFFMDEGADTGDILSQSKFEINFDDDASTLYNKMTSTAMKQIEDFYPKLFSKTYSRIPQVQNEGNTWRKRGIKDGLIDFRMTTNSICNLVRGLTKPYIGAHIEYLQNNFTIWEVEQDTKSMVSDNIECGKVLKLDEEKILVKTGDSVIWLVNHEINQLPRVGDYIK